MASELRYCENCGDIIQDYGDGPSNVPERFICAQCRGADPSAGSDGPAAPSASREGPTASQEGPSASREGPSASQEGTEGAGDLNLFSRDTIAIRGGAMLDALSEEARLRLGIDEGSRRSSPPPEKGKGLRKDAVAGPEPAQPAASTDPMAESPLTLDEGPFAAPEGSDAPSPSAAEGDGHGEDPGAPLRLVEPDIDLGPMPERPQPAPSKPARPVGASAPGEPAGSARRIVFRCVHCRAALSIRPVERTSRLTCPYCSNHIYVTLSGRLLKGPPSQVVRDGSVALGKLDGDAVQLDAAPDAESSGSDATWLDGFSPATDHEGSSGAEDATPAIVERVPDPPAPGTEPPVKAPQRSSSGGSSRRQRQGSARAAQRPRSSRVIARPGSSRRLGATALPEGGGTTQKAPRPGSEARRKSRREWRVAPAAPPKASPGSAEDALAAAENVLLLAGDVANATPKTGGASGWSKLGARFAWGVFLTLSLALPPLMVAGLRHLALPPADAPLDAAVRTPQGQPALFETFGQITRRGLRNLLERDGSGR